MNERDILLTKIQKYALALKELNLYLDTHPDCQQALDLFSKYSKLSQDATTDFIQKHGPIIPEQNNSDMHWSWINDPWPWERG